MKNNKPENKATGQSPAAGRLYRFKNWWYYHKWYVVCGAIVLGVTLRVIFGALGLFEKTPDFSVAYVGTNPLPDDTVNALSEALAALAEDYNGDGQTIVRINQYAGGSEIDAESVYQQQAAEITLIGDITDCTSYFFLMEDAGEFQRSFQVLARPDGSCPDATDFSAEDKAFRWADCPALSGLSLGSYTFSVLGETHSGDSQELLADLYLGRRCFYDEKRCENTEALDRLWAKLTAGQI